MPSSERHEAAIALAYARTAGTLAPVDRRSFTMGYKAALADAARAEAAEQELDRLKRVIEVERESAEAETTRAIEAARVVVDLRQELERLDNVLRVAEDGLTYIAAHGSEASGRYAAKVSGEMAAQRTRNRLASPPDEGAR